MPIQPEIDDCGVATAPRIRDDARRVAVASAIGTTIEWYDVFIYGTAAATEGRRSGKANSFSPGLRATILPYGGNGPPPPCPHDE